MAVKRNLIVKDSRLLTLFLLIYFFLLLRHTVLILFPFICKYIYIYNACKCIYIYICILFILRLLLISSSDSRTKDSLDHMFSNICLPFHTYTPGTKLFELFHLSNYLVSPESIGKGNFMQETLAGDDFK